MARPPLPLETWGKIRRITLAGTPTAVAYFRDSDGVTRKIQRSGKTLSAAENRLKEDLRKRLAPTTEYLTRESTLTELAAQWSEEIRKSDRSQATIERYEGTIRTHVNKAVGSVRIWEATVPRLQRLIDRVTEKSGPAQAKMLGVVLKGMFALAVRHGAAPANTAASLLMPSIEDEEVRAPTVAEVKQLRTALTAFDQVKPVRGDSIRDLADIGDMLLATGARIGEVLALRWGDIDLDTRKVKITATVSRTRGEGLFRQDIPKTDKSNRILTIPQFAVDMLVRRRVSSYCEWAFPSAGGTLRWPENIRTQWVAAVKGTSVEWITTRSCRKAVATLIEATDGAEGAADQLGHAGTRVTKKHYLARDITREDRSSQLDVFAESSE